MQSISGYVVLVTSNMTFASHSDKSMSLASAKRDRSEKELGIAMDRKTDSILTVYRVPPTHEGRVVNKCPAGKGLLSSEISSRSYAAEAS
jgi:hypothetical protein